MSTKIKRITAILLSMMLLLGSLTALTVNASPADEKADIQKGEFTFAPHTYTEGDLVDIYYYTDEVFSGSACDYNEHLATMSMILAASSISSQDADATYDVKSRNLADLFREWDFSDFDVNEYYTQKPGEQTMGVGAAYKVIGEGEDAYTLLAIVPRSAGYEKEWAGNFTVGKEGLHEGFATGRDIILDFAKEYVKNNSNGFEGEVKIWTVGYSRGAGVANLLGAYLDDNSNALGIEVAKENIFAYAFGTPSTVQFANDAEKAALESNYLNIHNSYSDYDIVTYAPFKNWNFTYYGTTKLFDVYNAEKKAEMLKYLENTNKVIYDLYTAENSSADPDNFRALMLNVLLEDNLSVEFVPAKEEYNIPNNQRDFLDSRVAFLVEHLVPDRATYVDGGYQHALQRFTSLYFGLNSEQSNLLFSGMSHDVKILAASYYCYFVADFYLKAGATAAAAVAVLDATLPVIEEYLEVFGNSETDGPAEWYTYVSAFITSEKYIQLKALLNAMATDENALATGIETVREIIRNFAVGMTAKVLAGGISALTIDETEKAELLATMTSNEVTVPLTRFLVYLLLGSNDQVIAPFNPGNKNIALAVTFASNAGRYMRVHNNEIILSWLRTEDSYYANEDWHIHSTETKSDASGHWDECECGYKGDVLAHSLDEWSTLPVVKDGKNVLVRRCACGYEEFKDAPVTDNNTVKPMGTVTIVLICVGAALVIAAAGATVIFLKKRGSNK